MNHTFNAVKIYQFDVTYISMQLASESGNLPEYAILKVPDVQSSDRVAARLQVGGEDSPDVAQVPGNQNFHGVTKVPLSPKPAIR